MKLISRAMIFIRISSAKLKLRHLSSASRFAYDGDCPFMDCDLPQVKLVGVIPELVIKHHWSAIFTYIRHFNGQNHPFNPKKIIDQRGFWDPPGPGPPNVGRCCSRRGTAVKMTPKHISRPKKTGSAWGQASWTICFKDNKLQQKFTKYKEITQFELDLMFLSSFGR